MLGHWYGWTTMRQGQCHPKVRAHRVATQAQPSPSLHTHSQSPSASARVAGLLVLHRISCTAWSNPMPHMTSIWDTSFPVFIAVNSHSTGHLGVQAGGWWGKRLLQTCTLIALHVPYCACPVLTWVCTGLNRCKCVCLRGKYGQKDDQSL